MDPWWPVEIVRPAIARLLETDLVKGGLRSAGVHVGADAVVARAIDHLRDDLGLYSAVEADQRSEWAAYFASDVSARMLDEAYRVTLGGGRLADELARLRVMFELSVAGSVPAASPEAVDRMFALMVEGAAAVRYNIVASDPLFIALLSILLDELRSQRAPASPQVVVDHVGSAGPGRPRPGSIPGPGASFTPRPELQDRILAALPHGPVVLLGLPGQGKTVVAHHVASTLAGAHPYQWRVAADDPTRLWREYASLGMCLPGFDPSRTDARLRDDVIEPGWLESVRSGISTDGGWLLLFDDVTDVAAVTRLLPDPSSAAVLITSRLSGHAFASFANTIIEVGPMEEAEACRLIDATRRAVNASSDVPSDADMRRLVRALGCHALALEQAGVQLGSGAPAAELLDDLEADGPMPPWFRNIPDGRLLHPSLLKTFERSFAGLRRRDRHASALLAMLAHLQPDDVPVSLLRRWARRERPWRDPGAVDRALLSLADEHLAGVDGDSISLHQITQRLRRASLGRRDRERAVALASDFVSSVLVVDALSSDEQRAAVRLWPHAASVGRAAMTLGVARIAHADLLRGAARQRMLPGDYQGASELLAQAGAIVAGLPDARPRHRATVLIDIATNERHQGRYLEAIGPLTRAIDDLGEPGEDADASAVLVTALRARAITQRQSDDPGLLASALDDMRRALALAERLPRGERRDHEIAVTHGELGRLLYDLHQAGYDAHAPRTSVLAEARASLEAAIAFHDVGHEQQGIARWQVPLASELDNLGLVLGADGRHREAIRAGARALHLDEQTYHARHSEVATDLANLARTLLLAGRPAIALGLARCSLDIREINELGNPKVGESALLVARSLPNDHRMEALALVDRALAIYSERLHPSGPRTAEALALRRELAAGD